MLPTSSIAMTTYNGERFLQRQLDSLAKQTVLPNELVVCDDGSTDKTLDILRQFAKTAPFPVRIFQNQKNLGVCANFRKVFFLCEKEIAFFCDQDDVWFPQKIEKILNVMEAKPEIGLVLTYDERINGNDQSLENRAFPTSLTVALEKENSFRTLFHHNYLGWMAHNMACRTCWRGSLFEKDFLPTCFDWWIFHLMGLQNQIYVVTEPCCYYRRHGGNITSRSQGKKNPFLLLQNSIKHHWDVRHLLWKYHVWHDMVTFFQNKTACVDPDFLSFYQQRADHFRNRIEIVTHLWKRPRLWVKELATGRYFRYSKGLRDVLSDLIAWPQNAPMEMRK